MQNFEATSPMKVFLVSGQVSTAPSGSSQASSSKVVQRVVTAEDELAAYQVLSQAEPQFRPVGVASLADYQSAVQGILNSLAGGEGAWPLYRQGITPIDG